MRILLIDSCGYVFLLVYFLGSVLYACLAKCLAGSSTCLNIK